MADPKLLDTWEARLREELKGLTQVKAAVQDSLDPAVRDRVLDIIRSLKIKLVTLLSACSKLRDDEEAGVDVSARMTTTRDEYRQAVRSLEKLSEMTHGHFLQEPLSLPASAAPASQDKDPSLLLAKEIDGLKRLIERTNAHIDDHVHTAYEEDVRDLIQDSDRLLIETAVFIEQHQQTKSLLTDLEARVLEAEGDRTYTAPVRLGPKAFNI